jgi:hypothetical protein
MTERSHGMETFRLKVFEFRDIKARELSNALTIPLDIVLAISLSLPLITSSKPLAINWLLLSHWESKLLIS